MINKKDPNKIRRFTREDLEGLIPNFGEQKKAPKDYTERKQQDTVKKQKTIQDNAKDLLVNAIEYYNTYAPNKDCTLEIGALGLHEELDRLSEKQLFEVQTKPKRKPKRR